MTSSYLADLLAQPAAVHDTLDHLASDSAALDAAAALWKRQPWKRIVLTGMGGSYYALLTLQYALIAAGESVELVETSDLLHYWPMLDADTLLVAVSQSGRSVELVKLLEEKAKGVACLALTNTPDSPLAQAADVTLLTKAGEERTVSSKTYVTALAALALLAARLTAPDDVTTTEAALRAGADAMETYLAAMEDHINTIDELVRDARALMIVGRGPSLAAVSTGALVVKEASKTAAEGMSSSQFRHGPFEMVAPGLVCFVFEGDTRGATLNRNLARDIAAGGGRAILVGTTATDDLPGVISLRLPEVAPTALPLVEILPPQLLSVALARRAGREPGVFVHITKVTAVE